MSRTIKGAKQPGHELRHYPRGYDPLGKFWKRYSWKVLRRIQAEQQRRDDAS